MKSLLTMLLTRFVPMFVKKNMLNALAISSVFVFYLLFILKELGKHVLLFSFIVVHVFLMSDLYISKVEAK